MTALLMLPENRMAREKQPRTKPVKVLAKTFDAIADIAEARGLYHWQVVESLVAAQLPGEHKGIQQRLKEVRALKAKTAAVQEAARQAGGE